MLPLSDSSLPTLSCGELNGIIELTVIAARLNIPNKVSFTSRLISYDGIPYYPGPTLVFQVGQTCHVRVKNSLPYTINETCDHLVNQFHCGNSVNIHWHGLHIDPAVDDISVSINPQQSHEYIIDLPSYHLPGTHFYHAHRHGSSSLQVQGGLFGMIIVENSAYSSRIPEEFKHLYANSRVFVFSHLLLDPYFRYSYAEVLSHYPGLNPPPDFHFNQPFDVDRPNWILLNGANDTMFSLESGQVYLFRTLYAGSINWLQFHLVSSDAFCDMQLIARDGIFQTSPYPSLNYLFYPHGGRHDILIRCTIREDVLSNETIVSAKLIQSANKPFNNWFTFFPMPRNASILHLDYPDSIFDLRVVRGSSPETLSPFPTSELPTLAPCDSDCADSLRFQSRSNSFFPIVFAWWMINSRRFDPSYSFFSVKQNSKAYLNISSHDLLYHTYHQHTFPFQVIGLSSDEPIPNEIFRVGEWRDSLPIPFSNGAQGVGMLIQFQPRRFSGKMVFHCHEFYHQDTGMMGLIDIVPNQSDEVNEQLSSLTFVLIFLPICFALLIILLIRRLCKRRMKGSSGEIDTEMIRLNSSNALLSDVQV